MSQPPRATDSTSEVKSDSKQTRAVLAVVSIGTLAVGVWAMLDGNVVTTGSMLVFTLLCVARLRSETVRRLMDDHQIALLVGLSIVVVVGVLAAAP